MSGIQRSYQAILSGAILALAMLAAVAAGPVEAQESDASQWRALRFNEVNMRVGPAESYPISWVYRRKGLPLRVLRVSEAWIYVQEKDGTKGWISESQLTRARGVIVTGDEPVTLREEPLPTSKLRWRAEPGVVAALLGCREGWCEINAGGRSGWVEADRLWGDEDAGDES